MSLKQQVTQHLEQALKQAETDLNLTDFSAALACLAVERPRDTAFGDYAVNVSPLARQAKLAPPKIADILANTESLQALSPTVIGGFINFKLPQAWLLESLVSLCKAAEPGKNSQLQDLACLIEFVSANPTGPLHIGHGRWVALGDSLSRILTHCGARVSKEFYINDAGNQIHNISQSIWYRCLEILETGGKLPEPIEGQPYPFYPGEYVIDLAKDFLKDHKEAVLCWDTPEHIAPPEALAVLADFSKVAVMGAQKDLMARCGLVFDTWFSEKTLHESQAVIAMVERLKTLGMTYEKEGALWFASSQFGDDQDRVLIKSDGNYTYLTADIAYHDDKYTRNNATFNHFINIWGADHHGYIARMKAAMQALGYDPAKLEIILGQLVNLLIDGERTRMGKRKKMLTFADLVDEVGVDAVRFWMVSKSQDTALDFNVELAASNSDENPVYYVQYAHARCCSILRNAFSARFDTLHQQEKPPILQQAEWDDYLANLSATTIADLFETLENEQAKGALLQLLLKLDGFEDKVLEAARLRAPHVIARYTQDVAADFHHFYTVCRILTPDAALAKGRLVVIYALKRVLAQALALLGVSAPEQM